MVSEGIFWIRGERATPLIESFTRRFRGSGLRSLLFVLLLRAEGCSGTRVWGLLGSRAALGRFRVYRV